MLGSSGVLRHDPRHHGAPAVGLLPDRHVHPLRRQDQEPPGKLQ